MNELKLLLSQKLCYSYYELPEHLVTEFEEKAQQVDYQFDCEQSRLLEVLEYDDIVFVQVHNERFGIYTGEFYLKENYEKQNFY